MSYISVSPFQDFLTETNQSRMNVLIPKLQEVNRCLNDLISCTGMVSVNCPEITCFM